MSTPTDHSEIVAEARRRTGLGHLQTVRQSEAVLASLDLYRRRAESAERTERADIDRETVLALLALGRQATNDPGAFTPRLHKDGERLDRWQARAVEAAADAFLAERSADRD